MKDIWKINIMLVFSARFFGGYYNEHFSKVSSNLHAVLKLYMHIHMHIYLFIYRHMCIYIFLFNLIALCIPLHPSPCVFPPSSFSQQTSTYVWDFLRVLIFLFSMILMKI